MKAMDIPGMMAADPGDFVKATLLAKVAGDVAQAVVDVSLTPMEDEVPKGLTKKKTGEAVDAVVNGRLAVLRSRLVTIRDTADAWISALDAGFTG